MQDDHRLMIQEINRAVEEGDIELDEYEVGFLENLAGLPELSNTQENFLERLWKKATGN